jgi:2-polyprenyl-6-hydroxyphenyl methylase/3-demethylubiquinone-9 3-methyltransferase
MNTSTDSVGRDSGVIYETVRAPERYVRAYNDLMAQPTNRLRIRAVASLAGAIREPIHRVVDVASGGGAYVTAVTRALGGTPRFFAADRQLACVGGYRLNHPTTAAALADVTALPFKTSAFDLALCLDIIEHLNDDVAFLKGVGRLLRPQGWVVVSTHNSRSLQHVIGLTTSAVQGQQWLGWDPTHVRFYNARTLREKLRAAGFEIRALAGTYFLPFHLPAKLVSWPLERAGLKGVAGLVYKTLHAPAYGLNYPFEVLSTAPGIRTLGWGIIALARKRHHAE